MSAEINSFVYKKPQLCANSQNKTFLSYHFHFQVTRYRSEQKCELKMNWLVILVLLNVSMFGSSNGRNLWDRRHNETNSSSEEKEDYIEECSGLTVNEYSELNLICEECYALHNQPEVYTLCR